jgi:GT2 family glycosyltransferase
VSKWGDCLPELKVLTVSRPGQVAALNAAIAVAVGDIVAFTDDDAAPRPDWLARIEGHFRDDPAVGGVGGRDEVQPRKSNERKQVVGRMQWFGRLIGNHHLGEGPPRAVDFLKGVNMSYRTSAIRGLQFDERLLGRGAQVHNDMAFALAVGKRGWKILYDPAVIVDHFPGSRFDEDARQAYSPLAAANAAHNETLIVLEHIGPIRGALFVIWSLLIGTRAVPGLLQYPRLLLIQRDTATNRLRSALRGRTAGLEAFLRSRKARACFGG